MKQLLHIRPINLNYNIILVFMLSYIIVQIISGIFLVMFYCSNASMAFISVEHIMRDVRMVGLSDTSCKWSFILLHRSLRAPISRIFLWLVFLSEDYSGVRCNHIITNDHYVFLGYVLLGVKCLIGQLRNNKPSSTVPSLDRRSYRGLERILSRKSN
jgi:hypothetical protein